MNWQKKQVSLYKCAADNYGAAATFEEILFTKFAMNHAWYYCEDFENKKWISGTGNDLHEIVKLRTTEMTKGEKVISKYKVQCYTPAGLLKTKKRDCVQEIERTGIMQLDFDYGSIKDYDIEELKLAVFDLPFIAFCGLSCSGNGFYALASIAEPEKLTEYAQHCFEILSKYGIPPDTTKGRNVNDLRFVSYDCNMLIRDNPQPLRIKRFCKPKATNRTSIKKINSSNYTKGDVLLNNGIRQLLSAQCGQRWETVQKVAYTLGGIGNNNYLEEINKAIKNNPSFDGEHAKYYECAEVCFDAGKQNPLKD